MRNLLLSKYSQWHLTSSRSFIIEKEKGKLSQNLGKISQKKNDLSIYRNKKSWIPGYNSAIETIPFECRIKLSFET